MGSESMQDLVGRNRPPRVQIHYKVQDGDALKVVELPFVVGVLADLSGHNKPDKQLKDRQFQNIDKDNFNGVLAAAKPALNLRVANTLAGDGSQVSVGLKFSHMDDFTPGAVAKQFEPTRKMLEMRDKLENVLSRMQTRPDLERLLEEVLQNSESVQAIARQMGMTAPAAPTEGNG